MGQGLAKELEKPIVEYVYKKVKVRKIKDDDGKEIKVKDKRDKIGVMVAGLDPNHEGRVLIGCSMTYRGSKKIKLLDIDEEGREIVKDERVIRIRDEFDRINGKRKPGFGKETAFQRAEKWAYMDAHKAIPEIPQTMLRKLPKFIERCKKYYKDKEFPFWTEAI